MNNYEMKENLREQILSTKGSRVINEKQIVTGCVFCNKPAHLYVKIDLNNDEEPILFNCFRCNMSGVVTTKMLKEFDIWDLQLSGALATYNKTTTSKMKKTLGKDNKMDIKIPMYKEIHEFMNIKKLYIERRLGVEFTFEELYRFKIVYKLYDLLFKNKIDTLTMDEKVTDIINDDYVGFLSIRNEFVVSRNIKDNKNKRYQKYSLFKNLENTRSFYTIPNKIDILTPDIIELNISEGIFDILGVYLHIYNKETDNKIYTAVCGSGYSSVIKYFISNGIFGNNVILNIFSDSDKSINDYKYKLSGISLWFKETNVIYNSIGKDFGVPKDKIKHYKTRVTF